MIQPYVPWPALHFMDTEKTLVVTDLHLGFECELAQMGINLPSQTSKIRDNLIKLLENSKPNRLIILGDLKHSIPNISNQEWQEIPQFFESISEKVAKIELIPGNHDTGISRFLRAGLKIASDRGLLLGKKEKIGFFHGHAWPSPKLFEADYWATGHSHPVIQFKGMFSFRTIRPVWVKIPLDGEKIASAFLKHRNVKLNGKNPTNVLRDKFGVEVKCTNLIVMPAFNDLLGGLALNAKNQEELKGPLLKCEGADLNRAEVFLTDGTFIGTLKDLKKFS
ncbi:MAG: metallophosphoesterase [Candidatus Bathyarchaeota archaeon]